MLEVSLKACVRCHFILQDFSRKLNINQARTAPALPLDMPVPQGTLQSMDSTMRSGTLMSTGTSDYTSTGESYTYTYTYGDSTASTGEKRVRIQTVGVSHLM